LGKAYTYLRAMQVGDVSAESRDAAIAVGRALKSSNNQALIDAVVTKTPAQMHEIAKAYKGQYLRELAIDIKTDVKDPHMQLMLNAMAMDPTDYAAVLVREGVRGIGTNEHMLTEILCTRSPTDLAHIAARYHALYSRNMLEDVKDDTSGYLLKVYVGCLTGPRNRVGDVDEDVEALFRAGEDKWGTDEAKFIEIICSSTRSHCEAIYHRYVEKHHRTLDFIIKDEMSGHTGRALATLVTPLPLVFAHKILKCVKPPNTKPEELIRVIVTQRRQNLRGAGEHVLAVEKVPMSELVAQCTGTHIPALVAMLKAEGC